MIKIQEITNEAVWTNFFNEAGSISFHQSFEWGEFQKALNYDILRLGLYDNDKLESIFLVIKIRSRRGNFLFIPHGPLFMLSKDRLAMEVPQEKKTLILQYLTFITTYLTDIARQEGFWFIRIAPSFSDTPQHAAIFKEAGFRTAPIYMHAETMWAIDIRSSEEEILGGMRKNTRYDIRKGLKQGLIVNQSQSSSALDDFWNLYEKTFTREHFTPFPKKYISNEFNAFNRNQNATFFLGRTPPKSAQEGASDILAASLVIFTKSCAFYHQGASIHSTYPIPHQVQWQTILEAKRRGCQFYNLYGIYKPGRTPISWEGLSLFKRGFGGFQLDYLPTQDFIISPKYCFSYCVDTYLAWRRGIK